MTTMLRGAAIAVATLLLSAHAFSASSDDWPYQVYVEGITRDAQAGNNAPLMRHQQELDRLVQRNIAAGSVLKNFYVSRSPEVLAPYTKSPVDNPYPDCGSDDPTRPNDPLFTLISFGAGLADAAAGTGGLISFLTDVALFPIRQHNQRQTKASCAVTCLLVPASLTAATVQLTSEVRNGNDPNFEVRPQDPSNWSNWQHLEAPEFNTETTKIPIKPGDYLATRGESPTCEMRMVCQRIRNWSDGRGVTLRMSAKFDATAQTQKSCVDFTMVSEEYKSSILRNAMNKEDAQSYIQKYTRDYVLTSPPR